MEIGQSEATTFLKDNESTISLFKKPIKHQRLKYIDIIYHFVCESMDNKQVNVIYIQSNKNLIETF